MKKIITYTGFALAMIFFAGTADAQIVIKVRPAAPVVRVRPIAPSPRHVWVTGNYVYRGGRYHYTDGYWSAPRYSGAWVDGYWKKRRGGWVWVPGYWRR